MFEMFERALLWSKKPVWGITVSYLFIILGIYCLIWIIIEPAGIPDDLSYYPAWMKKRIFVHLLSTLMIGAYIALIFKVVVEIKIGEGQNTLFDYIYETSEAKAFYDEIAELYDSRNSQELLNTHSSIISEISKHISNLDTWRLLDLGGGTGRLIAHHFFDKMTGVWVYIDYSHSMVEQFRRNLNNVNLKKEIIEQDTDSFIEASINIEPFDIVVVSLILSSLHHDPDWSKIVQLIKPNGKLIVSDIEATYTLIHPHYSVLINGKTHALRTRTIHLSDLLERIQKAGLTYEKTESIKERNMNYSFVSVFIFTTVHFFSTKW